MGKPGRDQRPADRDGVRVVQDERARWRGLLSLATVAASLLAAFLLLRSGRSGQRVAPPALSGSHAAQAGPRGGGAERPIRVVERRAEPPRRVLQRPIPARESRDFDSADPSDEAGAAAGDGADAVIDAGEYIAELRKHGETGGVAAFPVPGTNPPRPGVVVPPDYQLPEGFARHYQTTDDGRQLEPILVVAPEYEIVDDEGEPVSLADGRIVPPELAPPDLPIRILEVPQPAPQDR